MLTAPLILLLTAGLGAAPESYVLEFTGPSCIWCQRMEPLMERLTREGLPLKQVDVDRDRPTAERYGVTRMPTFILIINGQEIDRRSGAMSEEDLRKMLARAKATVARETVAVAVQNPRGPFKVELGEAGPFPRPAAPNTVAVVDPAPKKTAENTLGQKLWPFGKKKVKPATVRGNNDDANVDLSSNDAPATAPKDLLNVAARLRVKIDKIVHKGSGTIVESVPGRTLIVTCAHVLRDVDQDSKIEVDVFVNGEAVTYVGQVIQSDPEADVGLVSIPTDRPLPVVKVAGEVPTVNAAVACVGSSGGDSPSRESLRVTELNRYQGPENIECTGIPVQGRSGGGLFSERDELIGVCINADEPRQRGIYCGLQPIQQILQTNGFAHLVPGSRGAANAANGLAANANTPDEFPAESEQPVDLIERQAAAEESMPAVSAEPDWATDADSPAVAANPQAPPARSSNEPLSNDPPSSDPVTMPSLDSLAGDAEVVVILRPRTPGEQERIVVINRASPKFRQFLTGELEPATGAKQVKVSRPQKPTSPTNWN